VLLVPFSVISAEFLAELSQATLLGGCYWELQDQTQGDFIVSPVEIATEF
jgi:hypothetical protein